MVCKIKEYVDGLESLNFLLIYSFVKNYVLIYFVPCNDAWNLSFPTRELCVLTWHFLGKVGSNKKNQLVVDDVA